MIDRTSNIKWQFCVKKSKEPSRPGSSLRPTMKHHMPISCLKPKVARERQTDSWGTCLITLECLLYGGKYLQEEIISPLKNYSHKQFSKVSEQSPVHVSTISTDQKHNVQQLLLHLPARKIPSLTLMLCLQQWCCLHNASLMSAVLLKLAIHCENNLECKIHPDNNKS